MGVDYNLRIPVELTGQAQLKQVYDALRGNEQAFKGLSGAMKEFVRDVREEVNATGNLTKALNDVRKGTTGAEEGVRSLAGQLQAYVIRAKEAEAQTLRTEAVIGKIG